MQLRKLLLILFIFYGNTAFSSSEHAPELKNVAWSFDGVQGTFDRQSIQRGLKVYKEVCSACHSLKRIAFRNLTDLGFTEEEVKAIAGVYNIQDGPNQEGEMFERPGRPSDYFPLVYPNEQAARAVNNGAFPPDLSLMVKAREGGADYIYSLLTGYQSTPPKGVKLGENMYYNPYFINGSGQIAMPPPITTDNQVEYTDGTIATTAQMTKDVVNFLQWASEPEMEERKGLGIKVIIFTLVFTILFYYAKKRIWRRVK
ncbi:cytochrome c1 [Holosporaceae bacterium 'Namur']|nr:cytochrome c1 [Holosporaceae bacterium 'Namur']